MDKLLTYFVQLIRPPVLSTFGLHCCQYASAQTDKEVRAAQLALIPYGWRNPPKLFHLSQALG